MVGIRKVDGVCGWCGHQCREKDSKRVATEATERQRTTLRCGLYSALGCAPQVHRPMTRIRSSSLSSPTTCARCGNAASGNFCATCGANLTPGKCAGCDAELGPAARFCHRCGLPASGSTALPGVVATPRSSTTPWIVAIVLIVASVGAVAWAATQREDPKAPSMANAGNAATTGTAPGGPSGPAPDISSMSPAGTLRPPPRPGDQRRGAQRHQHRDPVLGHGRRIVQHAASDRSGHRCPVPHGRPPPPGRSLSICPVPSPTRFSPTRLAT